MSNIHVAFSVDFGFLRQTAVVIASIRAHAKSPERLRFHIIHEKDDGAVAAEIATWAAADVQAVPIDNPFAPLPGRITSASMLRSLLPEALPHLDRALYLDADIVVLRDLAELYESDLGGRPMGAAIDAGMYLRLARDKARGRSYLHEYFAELRFAPDARDYVNTGVLLMDLAALRHIGFSAKFVRMAEESEIEFRWADQDIINAALLGQIAMLDPRWNVHASTCGRKRRWRYAPSDVQAILQAQIDDPWVLHYTGSNKPWNSPVAWRADLWWQFAGPGWRIPQPTWKSRWHTLKGRLEEAFSRPVKVLP